MDDSTGAGGVTAPPSAPADRVLHSDPHDFAGLYIRHRSSLVLHARRYVNDPRDADEVVQEAFLRLFLALPELETELQALAYSRRTITNLCIDRFRSQARRPQLVALDSVAVEELADDDPGDPVVRAEDAALVRTALSMLSPLHRDALVKREIEEKTFPVIADELDIPEDTVKHVLFRARRALRKLLAGTSLVPGSDAELCGALGKVARVGPAGIAGLFLVLLLGLGSGPNLQALPVVGVDLPDLIYATEIAEAVGNVVNDVAVGVGAKAPAAPSEDLPAKEVPAEASDPAPQPGSAPTAAEVPPAPAAIPAPSVLPSTTVPSTTVPPATQPPATLPPATLPDAMLPPATLPDAMLTPTVPVAVQPLVEPTVVPSPEPVAEATPSAPPAAEPTAQAGQGPTTTPAPTTPPAATTPPASATAPTGTAPGPVVAPKPAGAQEFTAPPTTGGSGSVWKP